MIISHFLTVWMKKNDTDEQRERISSVIDEYVKNYCKSEVLEKKISPSGTRITVSLPCDSTSFKCTQHNDTIIELTSKLQKSIDRVVRAKAICKGD